MAVYYPLEPDGRCELPQQDTLERLPLAPAKGRFWLDCDASDDPLLPGRLQDLGINPLAIQDMMRARHPPKVEVFGDTLLVLMRGLAQSPDKLQFEPVQLAILVSRNWLITRHVGTSPSVLKLDELMRGGAALSPVELWAQLLETVSGRYLDWMLQLEESMLEFEEQMRSNGNDKLLNTIVSSKSDLRRLMRNFHYHEKVFGFLRQEHQRLPLEVNRHTLNDLYEKYERLYSMSAMFYDQLGDLLDGYISTSSHKLNNTMRILTVITAVFVPLSFLTGLYGMNFDYIPELRHPHGYFILLAVMGGITTGLLWLFHRFRWL